MLFEKEKKNAFLRSLFGSYDLQMPRGGGPTHGHEQFISGEHFFFFCRSNCHLQDACISDDAFHIVHIL